MLRAFAYGLEASTCYVLNLSLQSEKVKIHIDIERLIYVHLCTHTYSQTAIRLYGYGIIILELRNRKIT